MYVPYKKARAAWIAQRNHTIAEKKAGQKISQIKLLNPEQWEGSKQKYRG
jgi:hypothetical protein